jgi:hypothetical protein
VLRRARPHRRAAHGRPRRAPADRSGQIRPSPGPAPRTPGELARCARRGLRNPPRALQPAPDRLCQGGRWPANG